MIFRPKHRSALPKKRSCSPTRLDVERLEDRRVLATVVLNTDTGVAGELRTEIAGAAPGETIDFMLAAGNETITLALGQLVIDQGLTIDGSNAAGSGVAITIDADDNSRALLVDDGNGMINTSDVTLRNLTITGGSDTDGAGIFNEEVLDLDGVTVIDNRAFQPNTSFGAFGGGILNRGTVRLTDTIVSQNTAQFAGSGSNFAFGGGIASVDPGSLLEVGGSSVVTGNNAIGGFGGGIFMRMGTMTLTDSTVSSNTAGLDTAAYGAVDIYHAGGGISTFSQGPGNTFGPLDITITNSAITDNVLSNDNIGSTPFPYGGGFYARGNGTITMTGATISSNTITGDNSAGSVVGRGGAMFLYGDDNGDLNVTIQSSVIDGNDSIRQAGGIAVRGRYTSDGNPYDDGPVNLTVADTMITNNTAVTLAGGIFNWANSADIPNVANFHLIDSVLSGNTTNGEGSGGAARNWRGGVLTIENSTIADNYGYSGGGISNIGTSLDSGQLPPQLTVRNSTFSGNTAFAYGGAIYSYDGNLELYQSTLSENFAYRGGALYLATNVDYSGTAYETFSSVQRSTITLNYASGYGGGIYATNAHVSTWANSIISGNQSAMGAPDVYGSPNITYSYNYIGGDAMLGALADNGGPTLTHLPTAGSPVIDAADPADGLGTDQRGYGPRNVGGRMDIGSVEVGAMPTAVDGDFNNDGLWDCTDINLLTAAVASGMNDPAFDMNDDGVVDGISDPADVDNDLVAWLERAGMEDTQSVTGGNPFLVADANLDGTVDGLDFIQWNNGKFTNNTVWCGNDNVEMIGGNFNGDSVIDGLDFILWNAFKFQSSSDAQGMSNARADRLHEIANLGERESRMKDRAGVKISADDEAARPGREWIQNIQPLNQRDDGTGSGGLIHPIVTDEFGAGTLDDSRVAEAPGTGETVVSEPVTDVRLHAQTPSAVAERWLPRQSQSKVNQSVDVTALDRVMAAELGELLE